MAVAEIMVELEVWVGKGVGVEVGVGVGVRVGVGVAVRVGVGVGGTTIQLVAVRLPLQALQTPLLHRRVWVTGWQTIGANTTALM